MVKKVIIATVAAGVLILMLAIFNTKENEASNSIIEQQPSYNDKKIVNSGQLETLIIEQVDNKVQSASNLTSTIDKYKGLTPQESLIEIFKSYGQQNQGHAQLLIELIKEGIIDPNATMRERDESDHYTPLYAALFMDNAITIEQINLFIELGAMVQDSAPWRSLFGELEPEIFEHLTQLANIDHEDKLLLVEQSLWANNKDLAKHLYQQGATIALNQDMLYGLVYQDNNGEMISWILDNNLASSEQIATTSQQAEQDKVIAKQQATENNNKFLNFMKDQMTYEEYKFLQEFLADKK